MSEHTFLNSNKKSFRSLQVDHDSLQERVAELTKTLRALENEIIILSQKNITLQENRHFFDEIRSDPLSIEAAKAEFYLP